MAPKGTPPEIIDKMNAAIGTFLASPEAKETFTKNFQNPAPSTPAEFAKLVVDEEALWRDIIVKYDIRNN
ncbi:Tripartite tricarboxylate transporter family receptor [compost metagenome]